MSLGENQFFTALSKVLSTVAALLLATRAPAAAPAAPPAPTNAVRLSVELTDGSRVLGWPVHSNFTWTTSFGALNLQWQPLQSAERAVGTTNFTLNFRNGDHTAATPGASALELRTVFGDLTLPLALTRRIVVQARAGGRGLLAYWSFDDPSHLGEDHSGHGHVPTVKGAQPTQGRIGNGMTTGGPEFGKHLKIDSHPDLQFTGDFTLAVWALRTAPIYDGDFLVSKDGEFYLRRYSIPTERYEAKLFAKDGQPLAEVAETESGTALEEWTLLVVSRKGDHLSLQVNDRPAVEAKVAEGEVGGDNPLFIGAAAGGYPWQGKVDEIAKWDYALSEAELRELLRGAPARPPANKPPVTPPPQDK